MTDAEIEEVESISDAALLLADHPEIADPNRFAVMLELTEAALLAGAKSRVGQ